MGQGQTPDFWNLDWYGKRGQVTAYARIYCSRRLNDGVFCLQKAQQASDDASAMQDAAKYARRVRQRLGLTQQELSQRIDVSLETIRNWEQGKRSPTGAAKALLRVLNRAPEASLVALS